jgi:hypothetical protein
MHAFLKVHPRLRSITGAVIGTCTGSAPRISETGERAELSRDEWEMRWWSSGSHELKMKSSLHRRLILRRKDHLVPLNDNSGDPDDDNNTPGRPHYPGVVRASNPSETNGRFDAIGMLVRVRVPVLELVRVLVLVRLLVLVILLMLPSVLLVVLVLGGTANSGLRNAGCVGFLAPRDDGMAQR